MWMEAAGQILTTMTPLAPALDEFKKMIHQAPEVHLFPGDRVRVIQSPYTKMVGREYEVVEHRENGTLVCRSYLGAMEVNLYNYQVRLVHRPWLNKFRSLFGALAA
jgi:hypothetical protein